MTIIVKQKVLIQALIDGEIQNTVRTRLNLCSRQGEPLERELHKQKNRWSLCFEFTQEHQLEQHKGFDFKSKQELLFQCEDFRKYLYFSIYWTS